MILNYLLFAIFIALQFGDAWTTINVINTNKGHEGNPMMAWVFSKIGIVKGFVVTKVAIIILGYFLLPAWFLLLGLNLFYAKVVYNNYKILKS